MKTKYKLKSGNILEIVQDEDAQSPRHDDNLGRMVCWHSRYNLGDNAIKGKDARRKFEPLFKDDIDMVCSIAGLPHPDDINNAQLSKIYMDFVTEQAQLKAIILPLFLYDHSGITMNTTGFNCRWDSGRVGFIYVMKDQLVKEYWSQEWLDKYHPNKSLEQVAEAMLRSEVKTYDQYLTGDVYGFRVLKPVITTWVNKDDPTEEHTETEMEEVDSCYGFFGSDIKTNGILDYVDDEILEEELVK